MRYGWVVSLKFFDPPNLTRPTYNKLMEYLYDYCDKNSTDRLDDTKYLEIIESEVNNYVNLYAIYDNSNFNWLI